MLELITWIVVSFITQLSKDKWINAKWIILGLSIIAGAVYYVGNYFAPDLVENVWKTTLEIYGFSQIVYNYVLKWFETEK